MAQEVKLLDSKLETEHFLTNNWQKSGDQTSYEVNNEIVVLHEPSVSFQRWESNPGSSVVSAVHYC